MKMNPAHPFNPIGIFDSGVGGLSVLRAIRQQFPAQPVIYFADQTHVPYGSRSLEEVRNFSEEITRFLLAQGARLIVVACNTASAAALHYLREIYPQIPFVGMEPAVKPAAETTRTRVVGVLATPATFQGALYTSLVERFAKNVKILQDTCPGLVNEIEAGNLEGEKTHAILEKALYPMLTAGIDTVVMGCTHYPFVIPQIEHIIRTYPGSPVVQVIDPAMAIARQTGRLIQSNGLVVTSPPVAAVRYITSGNTETFAGLLKNLLGEEGKVEKAHWQGGALSLS